MTVDEYYAVPREHREAYATQRHGAATRGIPFLLTLKEWLDIWVSSGQFSKRGRGRGRYVMMRPYDEGPYAVGNVVIGLHEENMRDAGRTRRRRKIQQIYDRL